MKEFLPKGVRTSSEFLMSLHLNGAFKKDRICNLQIRMPAIVIGGGLTAIDVSTELLSYYPVQLKLFFQKYNTIIQKYGELYILKKLNEEELSILEEFKNHYNAIQSLSPKETTKYIQSLGGVTIIYRKNISESTAYKLNHHELQSALDEGIFFIENATTTNFIKDKFNYISHVNIKLKNNQEILLNCKHAILSIGNNKNINIEKSDKITLVGDVNPKYTGSVVKAINSASILRHEVNKQTKPQDKNKILFTKLDNLLQNKIIKINKIAEDIFEIFIHSPTLAQKIKPGQFFKIQNYSNNAYNVNNMKMIMEPVALTTSTIDKKNNIISSIILDIGASTNICTKLKTDERIILMGPLGTPTEIISNEKVMLVGGGVGNAVLFGIADEMKKNNCDITYFAGYKKESHVFKKEYLEKITNKIVWCVDEGKINTKRSQDLSFNISIIEAIYNYFINENNYKEFDRIIVIGSSGMMKAFKEKIYNNFIGKYIPKKCKVIASINSPMQCMMSGTCGSCFQRHVDDNLKEKYVFSCINQEQDIKNIDFNHLQDRLSQNTLKEKITNEFIKIN